MDVARSVVEFTALATATCGNLQCGELGSPTSGRLLISISDIIYYEVFVSSTYKFDLFRFCRMYAQTYIANPRN